jgi:hypothetical protein
MKLEKAFWLFFSILLISLIPSAAAADQSLYVIQPGTPVAIQNFLNPEFGCSWSGIGGQVFDSTGVPVMGLIVKVSGSLEGEDILRYTITGNSPELGPGGFSVTLLDHPVSSAGKVFFQLLDINGVIKSAQISLNTFGTCEKNLLLVNMFEVTLEYKNFFPSIFND